LDAASGIDEVRGHAAPQRVAQSPPGHPNETDSPLQPLRYYSRNRLCGQSFSRADAQTVDPVCRVARKTVTQPSFGAGTGRFRNRPHPQTASPVHRLR
jgi:hypothetical protein